MTLILIATAFVLLAPIPVVETVSLIAGLLGTEGGTSFTDLFFFKDFVNLMFSLALK